MANNPSHNYLLIECVTVFYSTLGLNLELIDGIGIYMIVNIVPRAAYRMGRGAPEHGQLPEIVTFTTAVDWSVNAEQIHGPSYSAETSIMVMVHSSLSESTSKRSYINKL